MGRVREDARWWSGTATPTELLEYTAAALRELGQTALCLAHRKRLLVEMWESLPEAERRAFLARVDAEGHFTRRAAE